MAEPCLAAGTSLHQSRRLDESGLVACGGPGWLTASSRPDTAAHRFAEGLRHFGHPPLPHGGTRWQTAMSRRWLRGGGHPRGSEGTSQIRAEMHGKGRFADARRPFRLPSECPEFLRRRFPTQSRGLRRPVVALSGAVLPGRTPEDTRSPRQAATSDVGHEHGGVTDKPTFSSGNLPIWSVSSTITAFSMC